MDRRIGWWGIVVLAVFGIVIGCGSPGPAPQSPSSARSPESSGSPAAETAPGAASPAMPPEVESPPPAAAESAPEPAAPAPAGKSAAEAPAGKPSQSEKPEPSPVPAAGAAAAVPPEQLQSWAIALVGTDVQAREAASEKLDHVSIAGLQPLLPLLRNASPEVRRGTVFYLLDRFDPADVAVVAALTKCLTDKDASVRRLALSAAQRFPLEGVVQSLPQLIAMLSDPQQSADSRAAAARLIGTLDTAASDAVPALVRTAGRDPDPTVRSACVLSVCRVAPAEEAVAALRPILRQDSQANLRGLAATRLGKLGSAAAAAAPDLTETLADRDEGVRRKAADALAALGPAAVAPTMQKLDATDAGVRRLAVFVLAKLGADAKPALDALRKLQQDSDAEVKQLAELAVRRIEAASPPGNR